MAAVRAQGRSPVASARRIGRPPLGAHEIFLILSTCFIFFYPNIIYIILGIEIDYAVNRKPKKIDTFLLYREHSWRHGGFSHACTVSKKQSLFMDVIMSRMLFAHYNQFLYDSIIFSHACTVSKKQSLSMQMI